MVPPEEIAAQAARLKEDQLRREEEKLRELEMKHQRELMMRQQELAAKEASLRALETRLGTCLLAFFFGLKRYLGERVQLTWDT